jgi:hypothetical protein
MREGRLKVFRSCQMWFGEYRQYHRKDGMIVKDKDDLLSATRYGIMMLRYGVPLNQLGRVRNKSGRKSRRAKNVDFDVV